MSLSLRLKTCAILPNFVLTSSASNGSSGNPTMYIGKLSTACSTLGFTRSLAKSRYDTLNFIVIQNDRIVGSVPYHRVKDFSRRIFNIICGDIRFRKIVNGNVKSTPLVLSTSPAPLPPSVSFRKNIEYYCCRRDCAFELAIL